MKLTRRTEPALRNTEPALRNTRPCQFHSLGICPFFEWLQQAYYKCAYECFDKRRKQEEISNCVEHCSVPVLNANNLTEDEMAKFQVTKRNEVITINHVLLFITMLIN